MNSLYFPLGEIRQLIFKRAVISCKKSIRNNKCRRSKSPYSIRFTKLVFGSKFFATIVDDFSRYGWILELTNKSVYCFKFINFV